MEHAAPAGSARRFGRVIGRIFAVIGVTLALLLVLIVGLSWLLCRGPSPTLRNMFVTTMEETSAMKFLPHLFLTEAEFETILEGNTIIEPELPAEVTEFEATAADIDLNAITVEDISGPTFAGKMMIVQDPARVKVASLPKFGEEIDGQTVEKMVKRNQAVAGINGGGFADENGFGSGGLPSGIVIRDGKLVFGSEGTVSSVIGLDTANHLVVGRMSGAQALERHVRDAVSFGPALIVNGVAAEVSGTGGGVNPRTVIGQRADGAILLMVIDGRQAHSLGATYKDCIEVMLEYGAVNAGNLDGGCSTTMVYNGEVINSCSSMLSARYIPTAFIVTKEVAANE